MCTIAGTNPFADSGHPVVGTRFLGRSRELRALRNRLLGTTAYGSIAVEGMPRIGKTSLVNHALIDQRDALSKERVIVVGLDVSLSRSWQGLLREMVYRTKEQLERYGLIDVNIERASQSPGDDDDRLGRWVSGFFGEVNRSRVRTVCVLDEFDTVRDLFRDNNQLFYWFRSLGSDTSHKIGLVLVSKRTLSSLARLAGLKSDYWANNFEELYLRGFDGQGVSEYYQALQRHGIDLGQRLRDELESTCSSHPFLLDRFASYAWQATQDGTLVPGCVSSFLGSTVAQVMRLAVEVVEDNGDLDKLLQITVGPRFDTLLGWSDVQPFVDYGILEEIDDGSFKTTIPWLESYLASIPRRSEMWPRWSRTERSLRRALADRLAKQHGDDWISSLSHGRSNVGGILERCERRRRGEASKFGISQSANILDYAYPDDLWQIMSADWEVYGAPLLGGRARDWEHAFQVLAKVRTPLAHCRPDDINPILIEDATNYCDGIIRALSQTDSTD